MKFIAQVKKMSSYIRPVDEILDSIFLDYLMHLTNWEQKSEVGRFKFSEGNKSGMKNFLKNYYSWNSSLWLQNKAS